MLGEAGKSGATIINQKMDIVRDYFKNVWDIDLDTMRSIVLRRSDEILNMEFLTFEEN
jgi:hypothetical protein